MSVTNHALGIRICAQVAWQFWVLSTRRCIGTIPWPNEILELDREFPNRRLRKGSQQKGQAKNSFTERTTGESCQWKSSRRDTCICLHRRAMGDSEHNVEQSGDTQEILIWSKHALQHRKWRNRLTKKLIHSEGQSCNWCRKPLVFVGQDENDRCVTLDIIPCVVVKSLETDAFRAIVANVDKLMVRATSARDQRRRYSRDRCYFEKCLRLCIEKFRSNEYYSTDSCRIGIDASAGRTWNSQDASGTKFNSGKKKAIWRHIQIGEPRERNPCAPGFEEQPPEETSLQAGCTGKVACNVARKYASSKPKTTTFYSLVEAPETVDCMFVMDSGASMHNAEEGNGHLRMSKNHVRLTATVDSANKRESTSLSMNSLCSQTVHLLDETPAILLLHTLSSKRGCSQVETEKLHDWQQKKEDNDLYKGQLSTSRCIKTVIKFR